MAILFEESKSQFYLHTAHTSYVMELYGGCLAHVHWGGRVSTVPNLETLYPFCFGADFSATDLPGRIFNSTDKLPQEYPTYGSADLREPALHIRHAEGNAVTRLRYESHRILSGKPPLAGLPAAYGEDWETLEITLADDLTDLRAVLSYSLLPEKDVLARSARLENRGNSPCIIEKAASFSMDLHDSRFELIHLHGSWARERHIQRVPIHYGSTLLDSRRGASSHSENPFFALVRPETTETSGEAYGFCLVYSGSFQASVGVEQFDTTRVQMGIQPFDFSWELAPGESFQTPEALMVYSAEGIGGMSRRFHRVIRRNLCRGEFRDTDRPVLINNWEATYFGFNEDKILDLAQRAKTIGVELVVLDDGWFGKRDDDNCSLGDWVVDRKKLPMGLDHLAKKVNDMGMQFGLWFEPEMVSPDSDLYRAHPDWCIHVEGRPRTEGRRQLILDLGRPEVCDHIIGAICGILESNPISYVKWDMNRNMTEMPYKGYAHRYMLGLYRVLETVTGRFPKVLFESCSGGGGRFDAGMLYYMPQVWTSDDTDAKERLYIQEGTSLVYPTSTMGAHVSAVPNHQTGRIYSMDFRSKVAMLGRYGLELDLAKLTDWEMDVLREEIACYKQMQSVIHNGDLYRLKSAYEGRSADWQIISEDEKTVLVFHYSITGRPAQIPERLRLQALDPHGWYADEEGDLRDGASLMNVGIPVNTRGDREAQVFVYRKR